ncbi:ras and Rab interactor 3 isoform X2 [Narcine bancroftii]|uniref:ras and Rab interactor 3 isoform X2 n=1 Tax=Narcine bancroftii TaxID=1343680 RepID=UPI003831EFCF
MMKRTSGEEVESGDMPGPPPGALDDCGQPQPVASLLTPLAGISILDKLIRTCPVWLQLNARRERVEEVLRKEPRRGTFMVRKDCTLTTMILSVNFPGVDGTPKILDYPIKEEKSIMYLDGSLLVFEDIFKMVAFYCVSRDILPSPLTLPHVIAEATNPEELELVSHLGMDFWNSYINRRYREESLKASKDRVFNGQANNLAAAPHLSSDKNKCSCEIELSAGNDKLWFVNPVFIKEYCGSPPSSGPLQKQSSNPTSSTDLKVKRPPPLPPRPKPSEAMTTLSDICRERSQVLHDEEPPKNAEVRVIKKQEGFVEPIKCVGSKEVEIGMQRVATQSGEHLPPIPPRRRISEKQPTDTTSSGSEQMAQNNSNSQNDQLSDQTCIKSIETEQNPLASEKTTDVDDSLNNNTIVGNKAEQRKPLSQCVPVAPPRRKKITRKETEQKDIVTGQEKNVPERPELDTVTDLSVDVSDSSATRLGSPDVRSVQPHNFNELKMADESLYSSDYNALSPSSEIDSCSTSSTEEELDSVNTPTQLWKHHHSMMLGKARNRLSIMALTNVLNAFRSTNKKILKKITELAQVKGSYFGQLIQDYRAYTLEIMGNQTSSTEMLQEIRQMMTQLKSYLLQSTELTSIRDSTYQSEDKLAKSYGADDFLPVLMYVLARSNLTALLLDVEYMMELLDPSLHLGEGYYYLTTTYGALEHIKHFDKQIAIRQLSHEVQDSIHQWERRRTLNMKQLSRSSMQDFLSVSFLEFGSNIKTFAVNPEMTAEKLSKYCAEKFGVAESEGYCLHLTIEEKSMQLAPEAVPHHLKSVLRKRQLQKDYYFIYKQANQAEESSCPPIKDLPPF